MPVSILNKIKDRYYLHRYVFPFVRRNENRIITKENTICLFCHPRGGSTWLAEILLQIPRSCLIDEPLQQGKIKEKGILKGRHQPYRNILSQRNKHLFEEISIPPGVEWNDAERLFSDIIGGRIDSLFLYDEAGPDRLKDARTYIVKFNYGHLIMPWLINKFSVRPVLMTRHPCAVVASQIKMKIVENNIENINRHKNPALQNTLNKYSSIYAHLSGIEEYLAFWWSVKIKETLYDDQVKNQCLTVAYESLLMNFENEVSRLFKWIDKAPPQNIASLKFKPSASTKASSVQRIRNRKQLSAWKKELSAIQIKKILKVVEKFEIDIYSSNSEPDYDKLYINH